MSENSSSASKESIMPGSKFKTSTITESPKSGDLIVGKSMEGAESTEKSVMSESFASKSDTSFGASNGKVAGKPSSSFINTSAVK